MLKVFPWANVRNVSLCFRNNNHKNLNASLQQILIFNLHHSQMLVSSLREVLSSEK